MTPTHKTDDECGCCLKTRPLLMPVRLDTIGGDLVRYLCLACRLNWRDGPYAMLATTYAHLRAAPPSRTAHNR